VARKPYRQKGTGRARQGSIRSPQYTAAAWSSDRTRALTSSVLPRQMKRLALCGALTAKLGDDAIASSTAIGLEGRGPATWSRSSPPRTRRRTRSDRGPGHGRDPILSARNLPRVEVIRADSLNVVALLNADTVLIEQPR